MERITINVYAIGAAKWDGSQEFEASGWRKDFPRDLFGTLQTIRDGKQYSLAVHGCQTVSAHCTIYGVMVRQLEGICQE